MSQYQRHLAAANELLAQMQGPANVPEYNAPAPQDVASLNALRGMGALGMLAQMGGGPVNRVGQALSRNYQLDMDRQDAAQRRAEDLAQREWQRGMAGAQMGAQNRRSALSATVQMAQLTKPPRAPKPTADWDIRGSARDGWIRINKRTGEVQPVNPRGIDQQGNDVETMDLNGAPPSLGRVTDAQGKSARVVAQMAESLPLMNAIIDQGGYNPTRLGAIWQQRAKDNAFFVDTLQGLGLSDEEIDFYQQGAKVIQAMLRGESGAAISVGEWKTYAPLWLPWANDTPEQMTRKMGGLQSRMQVEASIIGDRAVPYMRFFERRGEEEVNRMFPGTYGLEAQEGGATLDAVPGLKRIE